ncbi:MAG TPA: DALR domain-containing protein, partial [Halobacteriales archaeon]|nr:DALR domain-containing protein [Halobacteriales archaeon]
HHENEIAQSEAATGETFADYWLHVGMLETGGEKMSSSLRNFFTVRNAVAEFGPDAVRMFLLSTKYDQPQAYTEEALHEAVERTERLSRGYERAVEAADSPDARTKVTDDGLRTAIAATREEFAAAMDDDFNTREALRALLDLVTAVNRHVDDREEYDYQALRSSMETFEELGGLVLGFELGDRGTGDADGDAVRVADGLIDYILDLREAYREAGNYDDADRLRDALESLGVTVEDTDDGATYRY